MGGLTVLPLSGLAALASGPQRSDTMPLLFVGHGSPMNAITDNAYSRAWKELGRSLPTPEAILSISAHWLTRGTTKVTAMPSPRTIHDFGGFPEELHNQQYPAPGAPEWARETIRMAKHTVIEEDHAWGLDHGTWSVLLPMLPEAGVPVYQLSIDFRQPPAFHYALAQELRKLRDRGVLIMGSGNMVHNLHRMTQNAAPYDWAVEFDTQMTTLIDDRNFQEVVNFEKLGKTAGLAHPTTDHFLPLLYTLGLTGNRDEITYFNTGYDFGSVSMRSLLIKSR